MLSPAAVTERKSRMQAQYSVRVIAGTLTVKYGRFLSHKRSYIDKNSAQQTNNASEICCFSAHFLAFTIKTAAFN